jgi:hypothetical protein
MRLVMPLRKDSFRRPWFAGLAGDVRARATVLD